MCKILAIDTSTVGASVAVLDNDNLLGEEYTAYKLKHSEKLLPLIKHLLEDLRLSIDDIDYFACGRGPGSFTGLRIAAATIKAFAQAKNKPIVSVSSLEACANNVMGMHDNIFVIFDAQRRDTYFNVFEEKDGMLLNKYDDKIECIDDVINKANECESVFFIGDGILKYRNDIESILGNKAKFASTYNYLPKASSVAMIAKRNIEQNKDIYSYDNFLPNYIRPSAAQEERMKKMKENKIK